MDNYSVLLVDDDPKLLDLLVNYFTKEQFTVLAARDGRKPCGSSGRSSPSCWCWT